MQLIEVLGQIHSDEGIHTCLTMKVLFGMPHSSGGKQRLGRTSKMGQRDIRRLLISGAMSIIYWKGRDGGKPGSWLARMLSRKSRMVVAIALANKLARIIWAVITHKTVYRDPAGAIC